MILNVKIDQVRTLGELTVVTTDAEGSGEGLMTKNEPCGQALPSGRVAAFVFPTVPRRRLAPSPSSHISRPDRGASRRLGWALVSVFHLYARLLAPPAGQPADQRSA